jgi:Glycosyl transferase family 2
MQVSHATRSEPSASSSSLVYVLITPARDEARFIEWTITSVLAQTVRPLKWLIVSDGSTDGTDDIVESYVASHRWIELHRLPERPRRSFAGKALAFNAGYARLDGLEYDIVGNLDADITFDAEYFHFLLERFAELPRLGLAGTPVAEGTLSYDYRFTSLDHVSGACQLFRRQCLAQLGGYAPNPVGGIDLVAVLTARLNGWQTRTFPEKTCTHHRAMGTATHTQLLTSFTGGRGDYKLGGDPLWEVCHCAYQMTRRPYLLGGSLRLAGFAWAMMSRAEKVIPPELVRFRRREQLRRLRRFLAAACHGGPDTDR